MDIRLDGEGDLDVSTGALELTSGGEAVSQHLRIRYRFFLGEWFLDQRYGVAYHQVVFQKPVQPEVLRSIFRRVLQRTPGVASVSRFALNLESAARRLRIEAEAFLEAGVAPPDESVFRFVFDDFIIPDQVPAVASGV